MSTALHNYLVYHTHTHAFTMHPWYSVTFSINSIIARNIVSLLNNNRVTDGTLFIFLFVSTFLISLWRGVMMNGVGMFPRWHQWQNQDQCWKGLIKASQNYWTKRKTHKQMFLCKIGLPFMVSLYKWSHGTTIWTFCWRNQ